MFVPIRDGNEHPSIIPECSESIEISVAYETILTHCFSITRFETHWYPPPCATAPRFLELLCDGRWIDATATHRPQKEVGG